MSSAAKNDLANIDGLRQGWQAELAVRAAEAQADDLPRVLLNTSEGDITLELFENEAPNTVANFISLVESKFYNGTPFHRVLPAFMAQGGDLTLAAFLNTRLQNAESSKSSGKLSEAEAIWTSIKTLYEDNEEASAHVAFARKRLADPKADPGPPPWSDAESPNPESK